MDRNVTNTKFKRSIIENIVNLKNFWWWTIGDCPPLVC